MQSSIKLLSLWLVSWSAVSMAKPRATVLVLDTGFAEALAEKDAARVRKFYQLAEGDEALQGRILGTALHGTYVRREFMSEIPSGDVNVVAKTIDQPSVDLVVQHLYQSGNHEIAMGYRKGAMPVPKAAGGIGFGTPPSGMKMLASPPPPGSNFKIGFGMNAFALMPHWKDSREQVKQYFAALMDRSIFDHVGAMQPAPDFVNMSIGIPYLMVERVTVEEQQKILAELTRERLKRFPKTLFVVASGNDGCRIEKAPSYLWSMVESPNLAVAGACSADGKISDFSNFGKSVDIYTDGSGVKISLEDLPGSSSWKKYPVHLVAATSFSAPRFGNQMLKTLIEKREQNPEASSIDVFAEIKAQSRTLDRKTWNEKNAQTH